MKNHAYVDFGGSVLLGALGLKFQDIDWAGTVAFLGSAGLFLSGLANVLKSASTELQAWLDRRERLNAPASPQPPATGHS